MNTNDPAAKYEDLGHAVSGPKSDNMGNWISVTDKLPPKGKRVLCFTKYEWITVDSYAQTVGPPGKQVHWFEGDSEEFNEDVTHWMELPAPPEGL